MGPELSVGSWEHPAACGFWDPGATQPVPCLSLSSNWTLSQPGRIPQLHRSPGEWWLHPQSPGAAVVAAERETLWGSAAERCPGCRGGHSEGSRWWPAGLMALQRLPGWCLIPQGCLCGACGWLCALALLPKLRQWLSPPSGSPGDTVGCHVLLLPSCAGTAARCYSGHPQVPPLGVQVLCGLCVPLQWHSDSDQGTAASGQPWSPLSPLCCPSRASLCCWLLLGELQCPSTGMLHMGLESHWWDMSCVPIPVPLSLHRAILLSPAWLPRPRAPKDNRITSPPTAGGREVSFQQTQADASAKDFPSSYQQEFGKGCV